jgi:hypothetical protein
MRAEQKPDFPLEAASQKIYPRRFINQDEPYLDASSENAKVYYVLSRARRIVLTLGSFRSDDYLREGRSL